MPSLAEEESVVGWVCEPRLRLIVCQSDSAELPQPCYHWHAAVQLVGLAAVATAAVARDVVVEPEQLLQAGLAQLEWMEVAGFEKVVFGLTAEAAAGYCRTKTAVGAYCQTKTS